MRFMLVSAEDSKIKRHIEVPDNIVSKKRKAAGGVGHFCKRQKISKNTNTSIHNATKKTINTDKSIQKSKAIIKRQ